MKVVEVLHMNGGLGDTSYANNSLLPQRVLSMNKSIREEAMEDLCNSMFLENISIADLGCSSGPNTFLVVTELIKTAQKTSRERGKVSPEFIIYQNDLPGNDFNTIFRSLPRVQANLDEQFGPDFGPCVFSGVPGSFYGRLFASKSLHFVHSSYCLHFLSQVPRGIESNEENICRTVTSPPCVLKAYYEQFRSDFSTFLKCRSQELVTGGRMVLTLLGRTEDQPINDSAYIYHLLALALNDMVSEGFIEKEKLHLFNIPFYTPSPSEVRAEFGKNGNFNINLLEVRTISWGACSKGNGFGSPERDGQYLAQCMRAVAESMLVDHFGREIMDELFRRYKEIIVDRMSKENTEFINIVISVTRKAEA